FWSWDGTDWQLHSSIPPVGLALAYDGTAGRPVVMKSSYPSPGVTVLAWDGFAWSPRATTGPQPHFTYRWAWDATRNCLVVCNANSVYELQGNVWRQIQPPSMPANVDGYTLTFDPRSGGMVIHGGVDAAGNVIGATACWDGAQWLPLASATPRRRH